MKKLFLFLSLLLSSNQLLVSAEERPVGLTSATEQYICKICGSVFSRKISLVAHTNAAHNRLSVKSATNPVPNLTDEKRQLIREKLLAKEPAIKDKLREVQKIAQELQEACQQDNNN